MQQDRKQQIPGYKLIERLGSGGQANVYRAIQVSMNRQVAVKVIPPARDADPTEIARFMREARVLAKLRHDNIVQAIDFGEVEGYRYLVMEFIEGRTVLEIIEAEGALGNVRTLDIILQVCNALEHAMEIGVIHRDIKPANIVITNTGRAVLVDFGLARPEDTDLALTMTGTTVGTPHYMSPEQIRGVETLDIRADLYALGSTMYHMVTGRVPFPSESKAEIMAAHLKEPVRLPKDLPAGVPEDVYQIIQRAMEKDRTKRYQTPRRMAKDVETSLRHLRGESKQDGDDSQTRLKTIVEERDKLVEYTRKLERRMRALEAKLDGREPEPETPMALESASLPTVEEIPEAPDAPEMMQVPAGYFVAGEDEGKDLDSPRREVHVDAFWIDRCPVTNREYARFVRTTGHPAPDHWRGPIPPKHLLDHPVVWVSYQDAEEYAAWRGKRLPTPLEWQKAARGTDGRRFPWGEEEDLSRLNCKESNIGQTTAAGSYPRGASPCGCLDMGGNVSEWVQGKYGPSGGPWIRAVCGGSFRDPILRSRCASRRGYQDGGKAPYVGFRCAKDT
ncbi:MAG: bifunctional serine/threonine-protein kinase/formylglycine-generating enzyme family protein [Planctomycetes bacterium]|jgi:serine/threonine-protein kinase|nr:bifunctional serine/threonine-protein kinase/formylglycine-generating enzyme family protein [Planctomycetota bacterium]